MPDQEASPCHWTTTASMDSRIGDPVVVARNDAAKAETGWRITFMRGNLRARPGNLDLPAPAVARVKAAGAEGEQFRC